MLSDYCPACLSVCNVGILWPNGWMDQDELEVGPGPSHIVLDGDPAPPKWAQTPNFPFLLWPNGWMDQDAIWYRGRLYIILHTKLPCSILLRFPLGI